MKLKPTAILLVIAFFLQACTSTDDLSTAPQENHPWLKTQYRTYQDFLAEAKGEPVEISTTNGRFVGRVNRADADSIGWTDVNDSTVHIVPTSSVQSLAITHRSHQWLLGGLVGLAGTLGFTYATGMWEPEGSVGLDRSRQTTVVLVVIGGTIIGGLTGNAIHHTDQYLTGTHASADTSKSR